MERWRFIKIKMCKVKEQKKEWEIKSTTYRKKMRKMFWFKVYEKEGKGKNDKEKNK